MIGTITSHKQQEFTREWKRAVSGFFLLLYPLSLSDEKIASSISRSPWPSATQNPAGGRTIKGPRSHTRSRTRVAADVPTKVAPPDFRSPFDDDARTLSLPPVRRGFALHLDEPHGAPPVPHSIPRAHTSDHPHQDRGIHHAVVCRPCVLPHTTYVRRHATSAHAHPAATAAAESASSARLLLPRTRPRATSRVAAARERR